MLEQDSDKISLGLSPIEITCLRWAAEGRTMEEVAMIEGTSLSTVAFRLDNACLALNACDSAKAASTARQLKLV